MNADINGALQQINKSYKAFVYNGKPMTKEQVRKVLQYGLRRGYKHTGQISDKEVDDLLAPKVGEAKPISMTSEKYYNL